MITWKHSNGRLLETSNEIEALQSTIHNILTIACGEFDIFSWSYGNQLLNIIGSDELESKIGSYITDCLLYDDRVKSVENIIFKKDENEIKVNFEVVTGFGNFKSEVIF